MSNQLVCTAENSIFAAESAFDVGFDVGTSPHGLSVNLPLSHQETNGTTGNRIHASQQAKRAGGFVEAAQAASGEETSTRKPQEPQTLEPLHSLQLNDCEFLHAFFAVEHARNQTRKAISKGWAVEPDLQATDSLWIKLEGIMVARMMVSMGRAA